MTQTKDSNFISNIRKYRIKLQDSTSLFNSNNDGIAIFDLSGTFIIGYILDYFFNISRIFNGYTKNPKLTYYLVLIPLGVIVHILTLKKETFLNSKLFSSDLNVYKLIFAILILLILYQFNLFD
jgi:hypothetical protein